MNYKLKVLCLLIASAFLLCGCSESDEKGNETSVDEMPYQYDLSDYVKLGQYKGIEYEEEEIVVSDELVQDKINELLDKNSVLTESSEAAKIGDTVTIEYEGRMDGETFSGGSTTAPVDIVLGSSGYIPGFDDGVVGMKAGETKNIDCTFPDPYVQDSSLAGKKAVFTVTLNTVRTKILPEFNDAFAAKVSDNKYTTVAEFTEYIKNVVYDEEAEKVSEKKLTEVWNTVFDNATIYSCPQAEMDKYYDQYLKYYQSEAKNNNVDFADYLSAYYQLTEDEFEAQLEGYVRDVVERELVLYAIADAENITVSDEEYNEWIDKYVKANSTFDSADELKAAYSENEIMQRAIADKVIAFISDNAVLVKSTDTASTTTAASTETTVTVTEKASE